MNFQTNTKSEETVSTHNVKNGSDLPPAIGHQLAEAYPEIEIDSLASNDWFRLIHRRISLTGKLTEVFGKLKIGYLLFGPDLIIEESVPGMLNEVFSKKKLVGDQVIDLLYSKANLKQEELNHMIFHLKGLFGMNEIQWRISTLTFLKSATIENKEKDDREVRFHYFPYYDENNLISKIMIVVEDITEYKKARKQADARQNEMEKVFTLLQVSDSIFEFFLGETRIIFNRLKEDLLSLTNTSFRSEVFSSSLERIFRSLHTIKGNSKLFSLYSIQDLAHKGEDYLNQLLNDNCKQMDSQNIIEDLKNTLNSLEEEVESYATLRNKILRLDDNHNNLSIQYRIQWIKSLIHQLSSTLRTSRFDLHEVGRIQGDFARALSSFEKTSILEYLPRYENMVGEISAQLSKKIEKLNQEMDYRYFDAATLGKINDFLLQSMRNAIDHGIEFPKERIRLGKKESGSIAIKSRAINGTVFISVEDDGKGINANSISKMAVKKGLISADEAEKLSTQERFNLIFKPGFTTTTEVTTLSGRGVGMDAVKEIAEGLGGEVLIDSKEGSGTKITLQFPEKREEFMSPFAIYDFHELLLGIINEFRIISKSHITVNYENRISKPPFFLGDQLSVGEIVKCVFMDFFKRTSNGGVITCWLEVQKGRRRIDSYEFFRLSLNCSDLNSDHKTLWTTEWKKAETLIKFHKGSLIYREDTKILELNLPSFLPVEFSGYKIVVIFYTKFSQELELVVEEYFTKTLKGWDFVTYHAVDGKSLPNEANLNPAIIFIEGEAMGDFQKTRMTKFRERDSIIMISNTTEGIDFLEDSSILPDNLVFLPIPLRKPAIVQALTTVLLRRFAGEMVRDDRDSNPSETIPISGDRRAS